jgi:hypothetical protein
MQELVFVRNTITSALSRQQQTTSLKLNLYRHKREQYVNPCLASTRDKDSVAKFMTGLLTYLLAFGKKINHTKR